MKDANATIRLLEVLNDLKKILNRIRTTKVVGSNPIQESNRIRLGFEPATKVVGSNPTAVCTMAGV